MNKTKTIFAQKTNEVDYWDRPIAIDKDGNIYVDVSLGKGYWHCVTEEGEPCYSVNLKFDTSKEEEVN